MEAQNYPDAVNQVGYIYMAAILFLLTVSYWECVIFCCIGCTSFMNTVLVMLKLNSSMTNQLPVSEEPRALLETDT